MAKNADQSSLADLPGFDSKQGDRPSGLEELFGPSVQTVLDDDDLLSHICADRWTWQRWRGIKRLRAWEAIALHHRLDPDHLGVTNGSELGKRVFSKMGVGEAPLSAFFADLDVFSDLIQEGIIPCEELYPNPLLSVVSLEAFYGVLQSTRLGYPVRPVAAAEVVRLDLKVPHMTRDVKAIVYALWRWRPKADGGTYVPGQRVGAPDIASDLKSWDMPERRREFIASAVRREDCPLGRCPGKTPRRKRRLPSSS